MIESKILGAAVGIPLDLSSNGGTGTSEPSAPTYADEILLPPTVYAVQGIESNLYLKHMVNVDWTIYDYSTTQVSAQRGLMKNRYRIDTVSRPVGVTDLTLSIHDKRSHKSLATAATKLTMVDPAKNTGVTKKVLVIGDSWISNNVVTQTILDNAAANVTKVTLLGTLGNAPNKHEGRSGWTVARYHTNDAANKFWNSATSKFDFGNYLTVNSIATPDVVLIQLGINDVVNQWNDDAVLAIVATAKTQIDAMITSIHAVNTSIKVVFCVPPTQGNQDSYRTSSLTAWRAHINMYLWAKEMFAHFKNREANNTYVLGTGFNLDTENNFPVLEEQINARNAKTHFMQNNQFHPANSGYQQIGDVMFTFVKWS
ncbi:MAG: SGNH/GDSL hydrolase family protein [Psychrobacter sp.]|nr:SGNH/GDSL hydrolase family protein [Psychrobacter sp.]